MLSARCGDVNAKYQPCLQKERLTSLSLSAPTDYRGRASKAGGFRRGGGGAGAVTVGSGIATAMNLALDCRSVKVHKTQMRRPETMCAISLQRRSSDPASRSGRQVRRPV